MRRCIIFVTAFPSRTLTERIQYGHKYLQVVKHPLAGFRLLHGRTCCLPEASYVAGCSSCLTNHRAYHFPPPGRVHVLRLNSMSETRKTTTERERDNDREGGRTRWSCGESPDQAESERTWAKHEILAHALNFLKRETEREREREREREKAQRDCGGKAEKHTSKACINIGRSRLNVGLCYQLRLNTLFMRDRVFPEPKYTYAPT